MANKKPKKASPPKRGGKGKPKPRSVKSAPAKPAPKAKTAARRPEAARTAAAETGFAKPRAPKDTIRRPQDSEDLKQKLGALAQATTQVRNLKRNLSRAFYEIGQILGDVDARRLYEVKGYSSFEAFVERELDLGKLLAARVARIPYVFQEEAAQRAGLERTLAALDLLEGVDEPTAPVPSPTTTTSSGLRSPIPPHKQ